MAKYNTKPRISETAPESKPKVLEVEKPKVPETKPADTKPAEVAKPKVQEDIRSRKANEHETVKIGMKPAINYLLATTTLFAQGAKKITLKARGKSITTAVNVEEAVKRRVNLKKPVVEMATEILRDQRSGRDVRVSTIDILLELA